MFTAASFMTSLVETRQTERLFSMNVFILTGAGISAESGIPTFRGADGLWEGHRFEDVATPEGFRRNPELVHRFYNERRRALQHPDIKPNPAHVALANFEAKHEGEFLLVTQNIDNLHQRAGSKNVLPMHGELLKVRCMNTGETFDWTGDLTTSTPHPRSGIAAGRLRPHVVWFGEMPIGMEQIQHAAESADVFIAIGTSALVYPAAGLVQGTKRSCRRVEINLDATAASDRFDESIRGPASERVPAYLSSLLAN
jgi:NAD-dependent deacetylase